MEDWCHLIRYPQKSVPSQFLQDSLLSTLTLCLRSYQQRLGMQTFDSVLGTPGSTYRYVHSLHHIPSIANLVPMKALLIIVNELGIFDGINVSEARTQLRSWQLSDAAPRVVWHATQILRSTLANQNTFVMDEPWYVYLSGLACWAYEHQIQDPPRMAYPTSVTYTPAESEACIWQYLNAMNVPSWRDIALVLPDNQRNICSKL